MFSMILRIIRRLIYIAATIIIITLLGYNLNGLITGLGVGSVLITFAAQDTAKNMFGGLTIILDQPFKIGDSIQVDKYKGTVEDITFRSTRIRTSDDTIIYLPNAQVSASAVINNSRKNKNIYRTTITIDVSTNFQKIEKCKYEIIKLFTENELIIKDSINVRIINITEKGAELLIECAIDTVEMAVFNNIKEEFNYRIMQIFVNENIELVGNLQVVKIRREQ